MEEWVAPTPGKVTQPDETSTAEDFEEGVEGEADEEAEGEVEGEIGTNAMVSPSRKPATKEPTPTTVAQAINSVEALLGVTLSMPNPVAATTTSATALGGAALDAEEESTTTPATALGADALDEEDESSQTTAETSRPVLRDSPPRRSLDDDDDFSHHDQRGCIRPGGRLVRNDRRDSALN